jgi:hypothetical protein
MNVPCEQLDGILERQDAAELAALEGHAQQCAACALQLRLEREISAAAPALHRQWASPGLWPRIAHALEQERRRSEVLAFPQAPRRLAAAAAVLLAITVPATWLAWKQGGPVGQRGAGEPRAMVIEPSRRLLTEQSLREVQIAEAAYLRSIDRLAELAAPKFQHVDSALVTNYREKLLVLDSAIAEIRAQAERNQLNAHLRRELLAAYQAKQRTLQDLLREEMP